MAKDAISSVANAISELTKLLSKWIGSQDQRRMAKCIRTGDRICTRLQELKTQDKQLLHLIKKYNKYNN